MQIINLRDTGVTFEASDEIKYQDDTIVIENEDRRITIDYSCHEYKTPRQGGIIIKLEKRNPRIKCLWCEKTFCFESKYDIEGTYYPIMLTKTGYKECVYVKDKGNITLERINDIHFTVRDTEYLVKGGIIIVSSEYAHEYPSTSMIPTNSNEYFPTRLAIMQLPCVIEFVDFVFSELEEVSPGITEFLKQDSRIEYILNSKKEATSQKAEYINYLYKQYFPTQVGISRKKETKKGANYKVNPK